MLKRDRQNTALYNMIKYLTENKMSSAVQQLSVAVNESVKKRIIKALKKDK